MTVLHMRIVPDQILRRKAKKVGKIPANMKKLVRDMIETMNAERGVGLAASFADDEKKRHSLVGVPLSVWYPSQPSSYRSTSSSSFRWKRGSFPSSADRISNAAAAPSPAEIIA